MKNIKKFKKKFGQNFLTNPIISQEISNSINVQNKNVLEVGPGNFAITKYLLSKNTKKFVSIEIDDDIIQNCENNYTEYCKVLKKADALTFDEISFFENEKFSIISNLPFNISTQLLMKWNLIECKEKCIDNMLLMFQKELAQRILAKENSKKYGRISIITQSIFDIEFMFEVKKENFYPKPKVDTVVLKFTPLKKKKIILKNFKKLENITRFFFNERRKKNVKKIKNYFTKEQIVKNNLNKYYNLRAENIPLEIYCKMAELL